MRVDRNRSGEFVDDIFLVAVPTTVAVIASLQLLMFDRWAAFAEPQTFDLRGPSLLFLALSVSAGAVALRRLRRLYEMNARLRALERTAQIAASALEPKEVLRESVNAVHKIMGYSHVAVMWLEENRLVPAVWIGYAHVPEIPLNRGVTGRAARTKQIVFVPDVRTCPDFIPGTDGTTSEIACPILVEGQVVGVLNVETVGGRRLYPDDVDLICSVAAQMGVALRNAMRFEETRERAIRDGLTDLLNHAYFQHRIREEIARARRRGQRLALGFLDLDDFKATNDTFGHAEGDRVLRALAGVLRGVVRAEDVVARYGGEEFAIVMPETGADEAGRVAERIRARLSARPLVHVGSTPVVVTASLGIAEFPRHADTAEELIRRADEALYRAKRAGKNRVWVAGDPEPGGPPAARNSRVFA
ncbi:MAG: sensor domain-containing diguanylate cyclase [Armatimonadota bacterium]|nr:sensor domain-containing diguanylate cyclase [Armatimonadota bacterium]MDR5696489.1 sensor domain-containing diguanylate cyclase [Armatimonadota bacterium]